MSRLRQSFERERQRLRYTEIRNRVQVLEEDLRQLRRSISIVQLGLAELQIKTNKAFLVAVEAQRMLSDESEGPREGSVLGEVDS